MAIKRKAQERVQNYPSLFPELGKEFVVNSPFGEKLEGVSFGGEPQHPKKPRKRLKGYQIYNYKGNVKTSREKSNLKLWENLYPTPRKIK